MQVDSLLKINLYVDVVGSCNDFSSDIKNESVTSLEIPLTKKTMAIDITNNLVDNADNIMICSRPSSVYYAFIILALIMFIIDVILIVSLIIYMRNTRTAKSVYEKELKKIFRIRVIADP